MYAVCKLWSTFTHALEKKKNSDLYYEPLVSFSNHQIYNIQCKKMLVHDTYTQIKKSNSSYWKYKELNMLPHKHISYSFCILFFIYFVSTLFLLLSWLIFIKVANEFHWNSFEVVSILQ